MADSDSSPTRPPTSSPSPRKSAAGSGAASSTGNGAGAFFDDGGGPAFDAGAPPPPADEPLEATDAQVLDLWEERRVRQMLTAQGEVVHGLVAVDKESDEWRYTQGDLAAIAPPLTNILNRYDATRAAAAAGDELAVILGLSGYTMRSWAARKAAIARHQHDATAEPVSGVTAPEGSGPDEDYLATVDPEAVEVPPIRSHR